MTSPMKLCFAGNFSTSSDQWHQMHFCPPLMITIGFAFGYCISYIQIQYPMTLANTKSVNCTRHNRSNEVIYYMTPRSEPADHLELTVHTSPMVVTIRQAGRWLNLGYQPCVRTGEIPVNAPDAPRSDGVQRWQGPLYAIRDLQWQGQNNNKKSEQIILLFIGRWNVRISSMKTKTA